MLLFRLGRELGIWDINALGDAMPFSLLLEWVAFLKIEEEETAQEALKADVGARLKR